MERDHTQDAFEMTMDGIVKKSIRGAIISVIAAGTEHFIGLVTQVILARMLAPEIFGKIAFALMTAMFFRNLCHTHGDRFLIKEKDNIRNIVDNVFTMEVCLSCISIVLVGFLAPGLLTLLGKPELTLITQILLINVLCASFTAPRALFEKDLDFLRARVPLIAGQLLSSIAAIGLAYAGFGIWSLVVWRICAPLTEAIIIWIIAPYRPRFRFDRRIAVSILKFGWPLMGSSIIAYWYWNIDYYFVGRVLGAEQLGYYWLGFHMSHRLLKLRAIINTIALPSFSLMEKIEDIRNGFSFLTRWTAVLYLLPMIIMLVMGKDIVILVFGARWLPSTTVLQIFMVATSIRAIIAYFDPVCTYYGKTKLMLIGTIFNMIVLSSLGFYVTGSFGITGMAALVLLTIFLTAIFVSVMIKRIIMVSYIKLLLKPVLLAVITGLIFKISYEEFYRMFGPAGKAASFCLFLVAYMGTSFYIARTTNNSIAHEQQPA